MNFDDISGRAVINGAEYTYVRAGLTLCLFYSRPAATIGPAIADVFEAYKNFIPEGALQSYLSQDGTWKKTTTRTFNTVLAKLRPPKPFPIMDFYFGQEPLASVGNYGAYYKADALADDFFPHNSNVLYLEFPAHVSDFTTIDQFLAFVVKVAQIGEFDSGFCGHAFNHLHMTFLREAFLAIGKMAMRYIGFDVNYDYIRRYARGHVCNLSWLNLFGGAITAKLGGVEKIRKDLPKSMKIMELGSGVLIRAAEAPIVGDVNRGAADAFPLRKLAELTRPLRVEIQNLGPENPEFAQRWLARFDNLEAPHAIAH